jgi:hypothetical protein
MKRMHFYPNSKRDRTRCFQASIRMILKYFFPKKDFSYKTLDVLTHKVKGKWTWPMDGVLALQSMGLTVLKIGIFDYTAFAKDPEHYLAAYYNNPLVLHEQIIHSDIAHEQKSAAEFAKRVTIQKQVPTYDDLIQALKDRYLLLLNVNSRLLNRKKGYVGHFVVVYRITPYTVWMQDPGLPAHKNRRVSRRMFEQAWEYPNKHTKGLLGFRLEK